MSSTRNSGAIAREPRQARGSRPPRHTPSAPRHWPAYWQVRGLDEAEEAGFDIAAIASDELGPIAEIGHAPGGKFGLGSIVVVAPQTGQPPRPTRPRRQCRRRERRSCESRLQQEIGGGGPIEAGADDDRVTCLIHSLLAPVRCRPISASRRKRPRPASNAAASIGVAAATRPIVDQSGRAVGAAKPIWSRSQ